MHVVVVESPAKAKTINKYLGPDYKVLASYGHVRDLPSKDGSVKPDDDFSMSWEVDAKSAKRLNDIADALKGADTLFLATDPDREGEAIQIEPDYTLVGQTRTPASALCLASQLAGSMARAAHEGGITTRNPLTSTPCVDIAPAPRPLSALASRANLPLLRH